MRHLRAGQDQRARIDEAVTAFRRLTPEDYGHFLATIEADFGSGAPQIGNGGSRPLLIAGPTEAATGAPGAKARREGSVREGSLREAVLGLLADGRERSTVEIRRDLGAIRPVKPGTLNTEIFTLRKLGFLHSEGQGRVRRHTLVPRAPAAASTRSAASAGKREPATRAARRKGKRADDEDRPAHANARSLDAEQIYAAAISGHHLLTKDEEWDLARRLEEVEISLWERLLDGPLAAEARQLLLQLESPVDPASAREARAADLDRLIVSRVIAEDPNRSPVSDQIKAERGALRVLAAKADRIRDWFATCNLRMVPSTIRRHGYHLSTNLTMSDLIQEGNCGLLKAIPRFDHRRGLRFSTFATWWIRHYLVRARQNLGAEVRVPVHLQELAGKARRAKIQLRKELGRDPNRSELATALKVSKKSLQTLEGTWLKYREALPMFDSVSGEEGETPSCLASDDPIADEVLARHQEDAQIAAAIARMPRLLAQIVQRRFGLDGVEQETLSQIGDSMQLSRERIRQLEKKALETLRRTLDEITAKAA
jgi:RNA polymerase primary sigma factor